MIIPSIDLMNGRAVQLVEGKTLEIDAGDPRPIAQKFGRVGEIAVIDLDAALGQGSNESTIQDMLEIAPCRVGGGIRDVDAAIKWLDRGAERVILGTAATPEILRELPTERVVAALDAREGEVVVEGWTKGTGRPLLERIDELRDLVGGFLVTFVESEGHMGGFDQSRIQEVVARAKGVRVTVAGGVREPADVALADALGADAQVGMALYSGAFDFADALAACLTSDRADGLWPTIVCDERGVALGLAYSNLDSLRDALEHGRGTYWSRSRNELWIKGATSGATQELLRASLDCDRDALRFTVRQDGAFCHLGSRTCFGADESLGGLARRIEQLKRDAPPGSYTSRLFADPTLLQDKLREEAGELATASTRDETIWEAADVLYFALVTIASRSVTLNDVESALARRARRVSRRGGDRKPSAEATP